MMPEKFNKLREMEEFTDELFNRIFAFQEKTHSAWDSSQPFSERIKGLPLHNLIFSNPDRDPETSGPTVAHYYPLREENKALVYYAKHVADNPTILDVHARNGFVGSLLAREGITHISHHPSTAAADASDLTERSPSGRIDVDTTTPSPSSSPSTPSDQRLDRLATKGDEKCGLKVIGLRDPDEKPNQIADFYDPESYELRDGKLTDVDFPVDVAFSAWMPTGQNFTPDIIKLKPKLIIFIYTEHVNEHSKLWQTGCEAAFSELPDNYRIIDEWSIGRPENMLQEAWPDLSASIEETRHVRIFAEASVGDIPQYAPEQMATPYDWEEDLELALLAIEAKEHLRSRGIAV